MSWLDDVKAFRSAADLPNPEGVAFAADDRRQNALNLIREEFKELLVAHVTRDQVEAADAMADLVYVILFAAAEEGIPLDQVWSEVQRTNMNKADPATGKFQRNATGKITKPAGWLPPDIESIMVQHRFAPEPKDDSASPPAPITFGFPEALYLLNAGKRVRRLTWDHTAYLTQLQGERPYFSLCQAGYPWHPSWIPYQEDLRADDWTLAPDQD